ncbi:kinase-like domain-containing protein [Colletotrichum godetiae]|uniref:Kinase-like domain-containing protein n=1 Tax=Colletotrichum godetiae TaxID=1209918 RepID=A0AAJ0A5S1_9PEZI|nr:kinase-like domain-containing protein [Colletotrichum godetiae]KAK1657021.1 kinase-like domain-containing protein [Colletotrichum godetiae]
MKRQIKRRVWDNAVKSPSGRDQDFWPSKLFEYLFEREAISNIVRHLVRQRLLTAEHGEVPSNTCQRWTNTILGRVETSASYRLIFAILVLMQQGHCIQSFVQEGFTDENLPLQRDQITDYQEQRYHQPNRPFGEWDPLDGETFYKLQCRLFVRYISKSSHKGEVSHYSFDETHILPWVTISNPVSFMKPDGATSMSLGGGFGEVKQIVIHAWQHGFHKTLEEISADPGCFALKKLYIPNRQEFDQEVKHLKRFGGRHPHIVTLLATFTRRTNGTTEYLLLFPWAECDLLKFWERQSSLERNHEFFLWVVGQICGIAEALSYIHDPNDTDHLDANGKRLYGRHGDIKPENILWFKSRGRGTLVLSDLGLTRTHGQESRSNRPGAEIPVSPNYRPPECDIEGNEGRISRSFDIWTLGCLILEFIVWTLDGWKGYQEFKHRRMSPYINCHDTPIYFEIVRVSDENYAFNIKRSVTEEFDRLRGHEKCSQLISDLLALVQNRMLIVQSVNHRRIASSDLCQELSLVQNQCSRRGYCMLPPSSPTAIELPVPVEAHLNKVAQRHIANIDDGDFDAIIMDYDGPTRSAAAR